MSIVYFSHGGGPLPILGDPSHAKMNAFMTELPKSLEEPEAIVVFSAHWEENTIQVQSGEEPGILYDYYGFPKEAYQLQYPCKGHPVLANRIVELLKREGVQVALNPRRPYDHGSYIPLKMMYPKANIPVVQISLHRNLDPFTHLALGKALQPLLREKILFIGSGFSFHNMREFDFSGVEKEDPKNKDFQELLSEICCVEEYEPRWNAFLKWKEFPYAKYCHPREEHLLPLLVCAGLAPSKGKKVFDDYILGKRAVAILW